MRIILFAKRGAAPPNPLAFSPSMLAISKKRHIITRFAVREGCADHFLAEGGCDPETSLFFKAIPWLSTFVDTFQTSRGSEVHKQR